MYGIMYMGAYNSIALVAPKLYDAILHCALLYRPSVAVWTLHLPPQTLYSISRVRSRRRDALRGEY